MPLDATIFGVCGAAFCALAFSMTVKKLFLAHRKRATSLGQLHPNHASLKAVGSNVSSAELGNFDGNTLVFELGIDPGEASESEVGEVFNAVAQLHKAYGGDGMIFVSREKISQMAIA